MPNADPTFRVAVVAPTHNNARTLPGVLRQLETVNLTMIVIDDGSDDETATILGEWSNSANRIVLTNATNLGKATALKRGFERAGVDGFTHALTIDTDGQHDVADVPALVDVARTHPDALVLGVRATDSADYPLRSRLGRAISNALVRLESSAKVHDSQCGLRVYPLQSLERVTTSYGRYAFETEVITRLAWADVSIVQIPVRCIYDIGGGRISYFRPVFDSLHAARMHGSLIGRRFWGWLNPMRAWREIRRNQAGRKRFAASLSTGIFVATLPPYGLKTLTCLLLARWMRLQPLVVIGASSLNTPPVGTLLAAMSIISGHLLLHGRWPSVQSYDPARHGIVQTIKSVGVEWIIGSVALGAVLAAATYLIARLLVRMVPMRSPDPADASAASSATASVTSLPRTNPRPR